MDMITRKIKEEIIYYFLIAMIIWFFAIPVLSLFLFEDKLNSSRQFASVLLLLFR